VISFEEGQVVICSLTNQAGTIVQLDNKKVWVLLANFDIFVGEIYQIREVQSEEDLAQCVLESDRFEASKRVRKN
jgi:hypothetical protein